MNCPSLDNLVEAAFHRVNGEKSSGDLSSTINHARTCSSCATLLAEYVAAITAARRVLASASQTATAGPCLDDNTLAAFIDHALDSDLRDHVDRHLVQCDRCLRQLIELGEVLQETNKRQQDRESAFWKWVGSA